MITLHSSEYTSSHAELKVSYRRDRPDGGRPPPAVRSATSCERYLRSIWDDDTFDLREEFVVVCLTAGLHVIGWVKLSVGGMTHAAVDPRLVFGVALKAAAAGLVVAHNHPSGSPSPSADDVILTQRLAQGAKPLGLRLVEHMILTRDSVYCFSGTPHLEG